MYAMLSTRVAKAKTSLQVLPNRCHLLESRKHENHDTAFETEAADSAKTTTTTTTNTHTTTTRNKLLLSTLGLISKSCSDKLELQQLKQIHAQLIVTQSSSSSSSSSSNANLLKSYHYNQLIRCYARLSSPSHALHTYLLMSRSSLLPDSYTLPITLKAAAAAAAASNSNNNNNNNNKNNENNGLHFTCQQFHSVAIRLRLESDPYCESAFISLYCKSSGFGDAYKLFAENPHRNIGAWNAIIAGLAHGSRPLEAIRMFVEMRRCGFYPDDVTMPSVNSACGSLGDLELAHQFHKLVYQAKRNSNNRPHHIELTMMNSVIDMYAKCGRMDLAARAFAAMPLTNVSSWTSIIVGYATHGPPDQAIRCFHRMLAVAEDSARVRVRPNHVTFIGVLSACVHGGKVREGKYFFNMMSRVYGITPRLQHYGCMVDLLARAGLLQEARRFIEGMPMRPSAVIFGCLMGACDKFGDVELGEWVAEHLAQLQPWNDGPYVVLSNIYASRGLWVEVERIRSIMRQHKLGRVPAYSCSSTTPN